MTCFLPSEVARLVLGYLKDEQCTKSYKLFLKECPFLSEYRLMLERGQECPTRIVGKGLRDMLEEYGQLKIQETSTSKDVWNKFDTVVTQLKNVATRNHASSNARPQSMATFQKMRGHYNARKVILSTKPGIENWSHSTSGGSNEALGHPQESLLSDALSSPCSSRDEDESPNSTGAQFLNIPPHQGDTPLPTGAALGTSTPGNAQATHPRFTHNLPVNSPIVVSDSDHPFSPDSNPSTPVRLARNGARFKEIQESPKSHLSLSNRNQSPLAQGRRKISDSPVKFSKKENIEYVQTDGKLSVARVSNVSCVELTDQEKRVQAMRTGQLSVLFDKTNATDGGCSSNGLEPNKGSENQTLQQGVCSGESVAGAADSIKSTCSSNAGSMTPRLCEGGQSNSSNGRMSPVDPSSSDASQSMDTDLYTPVKTTHRDTTLSFDTPLKTPLKNLIDECSREAFRSPKRKSQAPKRRSVDPSTSKEAALVTPVKSQQPILSMPLFEELVNNAKFAEKLACSINQALCPEKETSGEERETLKSSKESQNNADETSAPSPKLVTPPSLKADVVTPKKPNLRQKQTPSPKPRPKKRVSFEKSEPLREQLSVVNTAGTVVNTAGTVVNTAGTVLNTAGTVVNTTSTVVNTAGTVVNTAGTDGNESTGSINPPLSVDEMDSILEDTQMSESTIQGIINMTQNDPELDALFNLINMDKQEFLEKEYGISLSDFKFTTPRKSSVGGLDVTLVRTSPATSSTQQVKDTDAAAATSVFGLSTMSRSQDCYNKPGQLTTGGSVNDPHQSMPVSSAVSGLPLIHVSTVMGNTSLPTSTTSSTATTIEGGFLQLLHSSTDSRDSYVETVQMLANQPSSTGLTKEYRSTGQNSGHPGAGDVGQVIERDVGKEKVTESSKKNDDTESVDSNSSEYTAIELPNGVKVDVMPVGTDINSQYQTLQTLTHLQKLLHSGCALTASGPAVSTSTPTGTTSVVTPVKVVPNPRGCSNDTSPGTSSLIETLNNQGLVMRTQPKLDTVDTTGLGLVSYQDETPVQETPTENTDQSNGKKKRGRPAQRKSNTGSRKITKGRNTPAQNSILEILKSTSPKNKRVGMRNPRTEPRKNLGIPSTVVIPASLQEQTKGQPILTTIDSKPVWLAPVGVNVSQNQANISIMQTLSSTNHLKTCNLINNFNKSRLEGAGNTSLLRQTLLDTGVPGRTHRMTAVNQRQSQLSADQPSVNDEPSPRRQLFGSSKRSSKGPTQIAALVSKASSTDSTNVQSGVVSVSSSTPSMGSMLFSPKSAKAGAIFSRPSQNSVNLNSRPGVFKVNTNAVNNETILWQGKNGTVCGVEYSSFKTPTKPAPLRSEGTVGVISTASASAPVSRKLRVEESSFISMPTDFSALISQSPLKEALFKSPHRRVAHPKARRIPLKTLRPGEGEDSFGAHFPNLVSNKELLSQPGDVVEIVSPTMDRSSGFNQTTGLEDSAENVSVENAMKTIEGCIDVETAQTLIKFASHAVITPKKLDSEVDQNSNHCILTHDLLLGVADVPDRSTKQSSAKKKKSKSPSKRRSLGSEKKNTNKRTSVKRTLRSSSRLNKGKEQVTEVGEGGGCLDQDVEESGEESRNSGVQANGIVEEGKVDDKVEVHDNSEDDTLVSEPSAIDVDMKKTEQVIDDEDSVKKLKCLNYSSDNKKRMNGNEKGTGRQQKSRKTGKEVKVKGNKSPQTKKKKSSIESEVVVVQSDTEKPELNEEENSILLCHETSIIEMCPSDSTTDKLSKIVDTMEEQKPSVSSRKQKKSKGIAQKKRRSRKIEGEELAKMGKACDDGSTTTEDDDVAVVTEETDKCDEADRHDSSGEDSVVCTKVERNYWEAGELSSSDSDGGEKSIEVTATTESMVKGLQVADNVESMVKRSDSPKDSYQDGRVDKGEANKKRNQVNLKTKGKDLKGRSSKEIDCSKERPIDEVLVVIQDDLERKTDREGDHRDIRHVEENLYSENREVEGLTGGTKVARDDSEKKVEIEGSHREMRQENLLSGNREIAGLKRSTENKIFMAGSDSVSSEVWRDGGASSGHICNSGEQGSKEVGSEDDIPEELCETTEIGSITIKSESEKSFEFSANILTPEKPALEYSDGKMVGETEGESSPIVTKCFRESSPVLTKGFRERSPAFTKGSQGTRSEGNTKTPDKVGGVMKGTTSRTWPSPYRALPLAKLVEQAQKEMLVIQKSPEKSKCHKELKKEAKQGKMAISASLFGLKSPVRKTPSSTMLLEGAVTKDSVTDGTAPDTEKRLSKKAFINDSVTVRTAQDTQHRLSKKRKPEGSPETDRQHKKHKAYQKELKGLSHLLADASKLEKSLLKIRTSSDNINLIDK